METHVPTTSFGRRPASLGQVKLHLQIQEAMAAAAKPGSNAPAAVNKWQLFRVLTEVRQRLGLSDRALGVLNALLSFHPETALTLPKPSARIARTESADPAAEGAPVQAEGLQSCELVVFPSNRQLSQRAHGMAEKTLRTHLASLVAAGLIIRRDSPNGKRYARKDASGHERFSDAFGFDLTPLVIRAAEFETLAEEGRRERRAMQLVRERITLFRRDIAKLITLGLDDDVPGPWESYRLSFMGLLAPLRSLKSTSDITAMEAALVQLRTEIGKTLETFINQQKTTGNAGIFSRHQSNSNTQHIQILEPSSKEEGVMGAVPGADPPASAELKDYPLGMVMEACPDVNQFKFSGGRVQSWPDFIEAVRTIRPMLGISPSAWEEAQEAMGGIQAHIALATILQRSEHSSEASLGPGDAAGTITATVNGSPAIRSAGGYLRALTDKARAGEFALGPVLMALIGQRLKAKRAASEQLRSVTGLFAD